MNANLKRQKLMMSMQKMMKKGNTITANHNDNYTVQLMEPIRLDGDASVLSGHNSDYHRSDPANNPQMNTADILDKSSQKKFDKN